MRQKWYRGHVGRFWDDSFKSLEYKKQPVTQEEIDDWVNKGYDYVKSFTGSMYDNKNPMPSWVDNLRGLFNFKNLTFSFYKMSTLEIMPVHVDHFRTYTRIFNTEAKNTVRILIMLEDWKPGHYLEIDGVGIVNWIAGDYFVWDNDVPHAASNIGVEDRYTLQITAEKINDIDVWRELHWFNIPELPTKRESTIHPYMFAISKFINKTDPYYIYMYNLTLPGLVDISHSEEVTQYLNEKGLHFYLYEPLCIYDVCHGTNKYNTLFYSEFVGNESPDLLRSEELDSILEYTSRNKLTNVIVHTCDYNIENALPYYNNKLTVICDDIYIRTCRPIKVQSNNTSDFSKKFINCNWRHTIHRHALAAIVAPLNSYTSWYYKADFGVMGRNNWFHPYDWCNDSRTFNYFNKMIKGLQHLNQNAPLNIDLSIKDSISLSELPARQPFPNHNVLYDNVKDIVDGNNNALEEFYKDIFCDVVAESRFAQPTGNYSEKVYQPMWYKKPFILAAPPNTLKYLKEQGFKTFSDFWDESYDEITIHQERLFKIMDVIEFIDSKSIDELKEMYNKMLPILEHNAKLVSEKIYKG